MFYIYLLSSPLLVYLSPLVIWIFFLKHRVLIFSLISSTFEFEDHLKAP